MSNKDIERAASAGAGRAHLMAREFPTIRRQLSRRASCRANRSHSLNKATAADADAFRAAAPEWPLESRGFVFRALG
jgi:hypothetical protein